ncbi:MAG: hydrogenase [Candidatus Abyssobacteria bacterium SURF_5]|uniref:Hydrogenase n=1 Tax=Abyssobacteria bacterium (strain SURF_5) TaxID=2093360 RepID=A0A3A4NUI8_ABYX5|nr:MAG: hydrogenase [Candidatus Abyssubacteria bacterium SURF_5]
MLRPSKLFFLFAALMSLFLALGFLAYLRQILASIGVAGINNPVNWGVYITNFVFWVGLAHSGTLISAILFLFLAKWRTSINRIAEGMTVIAIMTAGLYPLIHLGRVWVAYYLLPYPNYRQLWPNFKSPLLWDVVAITTYMLVSMMFFYLGLLPDVATVRDRSTGLKKTIYGILSLGWRGGYRQWHHYEMAYLLLAALATPLVISVHSVVSWDFAVSVVPGWHSTIFAPYFVAGAIFSGVAMIIIVLLPIRKFYELESLITHRHFDMLSKILIFMSLIVTYSYFVESFIAWYSGNVYEQHAYFNRAFGEYSYLFWTMVFFNCLLPLSLFSHRLRMNLRYVYIVSIGVVIGMWVERFVIIVTSLSEDYNPYAWGLYFPTLIEWGIMLGTWGLFFLLFISLMKVFPAVAISELKSQLHREGGETHE